jgi:hypothetical protein
MSRQQKLRRVLHDKHPGRNIILHDSACLTLEPIAKMGWEVLPHPSYSPDLAPSDCHIFGFMKDNGSNSESSVSVFSDGWNGILQKGNFQTPERWEKVYKEVAIMSVA